MSLPFDVFLDPTVKHKGWNLEDLFVVSYDPIDHLDVYFSLETFSTETVCNTVSHGDMNDTSTSFFVTFITPRGLSCHPNTTCEETFELSCTRMKRTTIHRITD